MRGLVGGVGLAMLCAAQPAAAQISFLKCTGKFADARSGKLRHEKQYWAVEDGNLYFWAPVVGLVLECGYALSPGEICTVRVTEATIVRQVRHGDYWSRLSIDRAAGTYSNSGSRFASSGTCKAVADPRRAPRAQ